MMFHTATARRRPHRIGEMGVILKTGDDVPMEVGYLIAQGREVDLDGIEHPTQRRFHRPYHRHQTRALCRSEIRHLAHMFMPDHPAKTGITRLRRYERAALRILP